MTLSVLDLSLTNTSIAAVISTTPMRGLWFASLSSITAENLAKEEG